MVFAFLKHLCPIQVTIASANVYQRNCLEKLSSGEQGYGRTVGTFAYMKKYFSPFCAVVLLVVLVAYSSGCHTTSDHSSAVPLIDSLISTLEQATAVMKKDFPEDQLTPLPDSLYEPIQYVQEHFVGKMKKDSALMIAAYSELLTQREKLNEDATTFLLKSDSLSGQMKALKQALLEHATRDKKNNEINEEYVVKALKNESTNVALFVSRSEYLSIEKESLDSKIAVSFTEIKLKADSLSKKKKTK